MKNKNREDLHHPTALTLQALEELKSRGFQYVRVNGVTHDHRSDYMEPRYFALTPLKELPDDMDKKGSSSPLTARY